VSFTCFVITTRMATVSSLMVSRRCCSTGARVGQRGVLLKGARAHAALSPEQLRHPRERVGG
jgi:hypothetical protein